MDLLSTLAVISYPEIDPVIVSFGPLAIRWYSIGYIIGILYGWWFIRRQAARPGAPMSAAHIDDFITWAIVGVIAGGRLGYVLFYNFPFYLSNPVEALKLWDGGMSFHGGAIGVILAVIFFCRKHRLDLMRVADIVAVATPVGIFVVRVANFINGELWGRATDVPWAMIFPADPAGLPRHPSQLYEAFGEGMILFLLLLFLYHKTSLAKRAPGVIAGLFFTGYGIVRILVEFVREPDAHLADVSQFITRGQMLSIPMFLLAAWLISKGIRHARAARR